MNRKEALQTLSLEEAFDEEALDEALDELLFAIKKNALSKYLVPALLDKQLRILSTVRDAYAVLTGATPLPFQTTANETELSTANELVHFFERYEKLLSDAKLAVQSARNTEQLHYALQALKGVQEAYMQRFVQLWPGSEAVQGTPSRDALDTGVALRFLRTDAQSETLHALLHKEAARIRALIA